MNPTLLCPIYLCDVLSFLPFEGLHEARTISRSLNATIVGNPYRLKARRQIKYSFIGVRVYESDTDTSWHELDSFKDCCREELQVVSIVTPRWSLLRGFNLLALEAIQDAANALAGELIFLNVAPNSKVWIGFTNSKGQWRNLSEKNILKAESAFNLLHLLCHLCDDAVFIREMDFDKNILNPAIYQALADGTESPPFIHVSTLEYYGVQLTQLFKVAELGWWVNGGNFHQAVEYAFKRQQHRCKLLQWMISGSDANTPDNLTGILIETFMAKLNGDNSEEKVRPGSIVPVNELIKQSGEMLLWPTSDHVPTKERMERIERREECWIEDPEEFSAAVYRFSPHRHLTVELVCKLAKSEGEVDTLVKMKITVQ